MTKKRLDINNFFRETLSDFELSLKEGNWELLNHLFKAQERKKRNRKWFLFSFCFIVMLSSGLLVLLPDKELKQNTNNSTQQSNTSVTKQNNSPENVTDNSTKTVPLNKKEIVKSESNNVLRENNSFMRKEKNSNTTSVKGNELNHFGIAHNTSNESPAVIKSEVNLTASQANISPNDSVKTNTITQETINQNAVVYDSLLTKSFNNDTLNVIAKNNLPADSSISKQLISAKSNFLNYNFYAGLNIYSTSSAFTNQQNISPLIGLEFMHPLTSNFTVGLAGLYSFQSGYHLNDTISQESYFFDKNVSQQTIQIRQLHKLYFPLTLYYTLTKSHAVSCAIQLSYLVNTNGNYTEVNTISGVTNQSQKNNVKGYMDGIKQTNIAVSLGYQYKLSKTFDVSTRFIRELKDSYIKEYFYGVNTKPSWSLQTFLIVKF